MAKPRNEGVGDNEQAVAGAAAPANESAQDPAGLFARDEGTGAATGGSSAELTSPDGGMAPAGGGDAAGAASAARYKLNGEELTAAEVMRRFAASPDQVVDLWTAREQLKAHQRALIEDRQRYEQRLEQLSRRLDQAQRPPEKPFTKDDWAAKHEPVIKNLIANGLITEDQYQAIPEVVHLLVDGFQRVLALHSRFEQFEGAVMGTWQEQLSPLVSGLQEAQVVQERSAILGQIERNMDELAREPGYDGLATEEGRRQFIQYIRKVNPETELLTGPDSKQVLADLFIAANREQVMKTILAARQASTATRVPASASVGEGAGGARGRGRGGRNSDIVAAFESQQRGG